jgi:putative salt-induced outer membrane protein YdiY
LKPANKPASPEESVKNAILILLFSSVVSIRMFADQVVLKNGDRLSGTIVKSDGKGLVMKTEFAGDVTVQWAAVQDVTSAAPLNIALKDGQTAVGPVSTTDGKIEVATKTGGVVEAPKENIVLIRNEAEQTAYEKSLNPGFRENWDGGANVGFALTRGNSQTKNLAVAFNANRKTLHDKLGLYAGTVYATNDAPGAVPSTTANAEQGGIRYDRDITPRLFGFVNADFQADSLQTLDLRSVFGGGLGFHAIKREATTLDLLAGANYTHEKYTTVSNNFAAATLGEEFLHKVHASTIITQSLYFFPNLSNTGDYRGTFNFGTVTKISKWIGWQNSFGDIYVSNPPLGKKKNDIVFTTGLNLSFTH